jgi:hypothetical protein
MVGEIESSFPKLQTAAYRITSAASRDYNCIAWAAGDSRRWWWPEDDPDNDAIYWPVGVAHEESLNAFVAAFALLGYLPCDNETPELGVEKVAFFADAGSIPTHAARQLPSGRWTSKLGFLEDIEHDLHDVAGEAYGTVAVVLKRPLLPVSGSAPVS